MFQFGALKLIPISSIKRQRWECFSLLSVEDDEVSLYAVEPLLELTVLHKHNNNNTNYNYTAITTCFRLELVGMNNQTETEKGHSRSQLQHLLDVFIRRDLQTSFCQ